MSETGVSVWELREMARNMENDSSNKIGMLPGYRNAVIVEALRCLADTKERRRELRNDPLPLGVSA